MGYSHRHGGQTHQMCDSRDLIFHAMLSDEVFTVRGPKISTSVLLVIRIFSTVAHNVQTHIGGAAGSNPRRPTQMKSQPSEKIRDSRTNGDACCRDHAHNVYDLDSGSVVRIQRERAAIVLPIWTQSDLLNDLSRTGWVADATWRIGRIIGKPGKVVQLVRALSRPLPDTHAEVAILRGPCGVHELRSVAMPCDQSVVDRRVIRWPAYIALGSERHMPHANDWITVISNPQ